MAIPPILPLQPVSKPAKPQAPGKTQHANAPKFAQDRFAEKEKDFMDATVKAHSEDSNISLLSEHGYFKVFDYDLVKKNTVKQKTVFFVNKESKTVVETRGHIAVNYLSIIPNRSNIVDFPISNERPQKKNKKDRISRFSNYTLRWDRGTFKVTKELYLEFNPDKEDKIIAFNEEYDLDNKNIAIKNWKTVVADRGYTKYRSSRKLRKTGTPTQILLHETADRNNLPITGVGKDGNTYTIPHFCIYNIDAKTQKGNVVQYLDVAERTSHGVQMNERSVGIEFVNPPVEAFKDGSPLFNLTQAKDGIYLKTVIPTVPYNRLFIPLEFSADNKSKNYFELKIPSAKLINAAHLKLLKIDNVNIATEMDKEITIKYCKSEKFEHLASLLRTLCSKDILDIDLTSFETWKVNVKEKDQELFVFNKAYKNFGDGKGDLYWLDARAKGIYCHGFSGDHGDGYLQALYCFWKFHKKLEKHEDALKKVIHYLLNGKLTKIKRKAVVTYKDEKLSEFTGDREWEIGDCIIM